MEKKKATLPHETKELFLTDGGLETTLIFLEGYELPCFAAFDLLKILEGRQALKNYYRSYLNIAQKFQTGFILETPTWRANPDWIIKIGYQENELSKIIHKAVHLMFELKEEYAGFVPHLVISGCVGPRGDGYVPSGAMNSEEAERYHAQQIAEFKKQDVQMISAITMNYAEEAIGIARAAEAAGLPCVISFTVETDGKLPTGMRLKEAIETVDESVTQPPVYYMINCAHPEHFMEEMMAGKEERWTSRIRGLRANASCKSHAELDESTELDRGHPDELSSYHQKLKAELKHLNVFGGCCGTDDEHVMAIAHSVGGEIKPA